MKLHRKPTGYVGPVSFPAVGGAPRFDRVRFPDTKGEIEAFILDLTLKAFRREGFEPWPAVPVRNPESDFDFTIPGETNQYLELMEVAPLEGTRGFAAAILEHHHGALADLVWTTLTQKARRYGLPQSYAVHLLIYTTDTAFQLFPEVLRIIAYHLLVSDRGFATVHYSVPADQDSAYVYCLHPRPAQEFERYNIRAARSRRSLVADPTRMTVVNRRSIQMPLGGQREQSQK
jgi:hypothetical protein